jgi:hypothetical protein
MFKSPLVIEISDIVGIVTIKPIETWSEQQLKEAF